jgi:enamine deaminase RidA (YjgF/YER057c/UK114 family)
LNTPKQTSAANLAMCAASDFKTQGPTTMFLTIKHLLIGGLIVMGISTSATAQELTIVNPPKLGDPAPMGYSTAVIAPANARVAYISGQGGFDSKGTLSPDFATQVTQAYANLGAALEGIGAKPNQVAKLTIYVVDHDMSKLGVLTQSVVTMFGNKLPAQTLVPVPKLAIDPMLFEVEAVVILD